MINWKEKILSAQPISEFSIIDCHNHLGRWNGFHIPQDGTIDQMIRAMDSFGIDQCFITAHASIGPDYVYGNDMVRDAANKYPDRVLGYVTVNPNYPEDLQNELDRCFAHKAFKGIKLHPDCHGRPIDYYQYDPAYKYADDNALPVLIHVWGAHQVAAIERLSAEYPNIRFIMGHAGADTPGMLKAIELINKRDNVYGDTAVSMAFQGNIEWLAGEANTKRILFGSDMPFYNAAHTVARIAMAELSDDVKKDIFGANMERVLSRTDRG